MRYYPSVNMVLTVALLGFFGGVILWELQPIASAPPADPLPTWPAPVPLPPLLFIDRVSETGMGNGALELRGTHVVTMNCFATPEPVCYVLSERQVKPTP